MTLEQHVLRHVPTTNRTLAQVAERVARGTAMPVDDAPTIFDPPDHATYVLTDRRTQKSRPTWIAPVALVVAILVAAFAITKLVLTS